MTALLEGQRPLPERAKPFEEFTTAINAELRRLNLPVPAGAPAS